MGVTIVEPILPFYAESFKVSALELGLLYSSYAAMSCLATICMGRLSDKYGRRKLIIFSLFGTMVGFLLHGFAQNYTELLIYRFITGAFGGSYTIVAAYVTDIIPEKQRPTYLAAAGACMSCAYIVGPGIGSALVVFGLRVPFFASSGLGLIGLIFAIVFLQESHPKFRKRNNSQEEEEKAEDRSSTIEPSIQDSSIPMAMWIIFCIYFSAAIAFAAYSSMWPLYMIEEFNISAAELGLITLIMSIIYVFNTMVIFSFIAKKVGHYFACFIGYNIFAVTLLICTFISNVWIHVTIMVVGVGAGFGIIAPAMSSIAADYTNEKNRGKIHSLISASYDLAIVVGPILHGILFEIDIRYPFLLGAIFVTIGNITLVIFMISYVFKQGNISQK